MARGRVCSPSPDKNHRRIRLAPRHHFFTSAVGGGSMVDVPEWERLADALKRVVATGLTETQAKIAICSAISDRSITVQLFLGNFERANIFLQEGWESEVPPSRTPESFDMWRRAQTGLPPRPRTLMIPSHIAPEDFDWQGSRPLKPWRDPQGSFSFFDWHGDRLELCSADVTRVLIASKSAPQSVTITRTESKSRLAVERVQPARERAKKAVDAIYGSNIPDQANEPNTMLCKNVGAKLKELNLPDVSDETILRAAGRRKDKRGRSRHG
jgi:hypothetical protein